MTRPEEEHVDESIAIIGIGCRFPDAASPADFWRNLCDGVESIREFSREEQLAKGMDPALLDHPDFVSSGTRLGNVDMFDASFFGFSAREAEILDPQHRLFLECAWEALERAGYDPSRYDGSIGVFAGVNSSRYIFNLYSNPQIMESAGTFQVLVGNDKDHLATRVSYKLDLTGPALTVQTACSTSLVAVSQACQSLVAYECDMALAGGSAIALPQGFGYLYQEGGIASPDGHCRAFDASAKGTVGGSGSGVVVLKREEQAREDGDHIHAVIKGSALNNDGSSKVGYSAPSIDGQAEVIGMALEIAQIDPETITYVEAHGTGTTLGDPIEVAALTKAYRSHTDKVGYCGLGSVKTNIGHLDSAAGVAGPIKAVLAVEHGLLPPSLNFKEPNPNIDFASSPFYVNARLREWTTPDGTPRRAGVSSFGIGGTNAHVIVEEAPPIRATANAREAELLVLSAASAAALDRATARLVGHLGSRPDLDLADAAHTLQVGRKQLPHRRIRVTPVSDPGERPRWPESEDGRWVSGRVQGSASPPVAFLFTGQGSQYVNMGRGLYRSEPRYRDRVDRCCELLRPHLELDLREVLHPADGHEEQADERLIQTVMAQPALFVLEFALAKLWMDWGVRPSAMAGHSIGEYVAACLAGVLPLERALALVAKRGQLMQKMPPGGMLAVPLPEEEICSLLDEDLSLAVLNAPGMGVVSGPLDAIERLEKRLSETPTPAKRLHTSRAFHSKLTEGVMQPLADYAETLALQPPEIPYLSNVTGTWITPEQATSPAYWAEHMRATVRFKDNLETLLQDDEMVLLEVGPGHTLSDLARLSAPPGAHRVVLPSLPHPRQKKDDLECLLGALGRLWLAGVEVDWSAHHAGRTRSRVELPTYPFERKRYWIAPSTTAPARARSEGPAPGEGGRVADILYLPTWQRTRITDPSRAAAAAADGSWLIFLDPLGLGAAMKQRLEEAGHEVVTVTPGEAFGSTDESSFTLATATTAGYEELFAQLDRAGKTPSRIAHLWCVGPTGDALTVDSFEASQDLGFHSLVGIAQAMEKSNVTRRVELAVVSSGLHMVAGDEPLAAERATALGPCRVIPQEYPNIHCSNIDVDVLGADEERLQQLAARILAEMTVEPFEPTVAYRNGRRWVQAFDQIRLGAIDAGTRLRSQGVYLITGGLGQIGLTLAEYLVRTVQARLVLVGRSPFPARHQWEGRLAETGDQRLEARIRKLLEIESLGGQVMVASADVADTGQVQRVVNQAIQRFGAIHGVIHGAGTTAADSLLPVRETDRAAASRHFGPKALGLMSLTAALDGTEPDFWLMLSSLSTVLGGLGFASYAAGNSFLDVFSMRQTATTGVPWITTNWDAWAFPPMTTGAGGLAAVTPDDGAEAFARILERAPQQMVISASPLQPRYEQWIRLATVRAQEEDEGGAASAQHARPDLTTPFVAPASELEQVVAKAWEEALGIAPVGRNDDFFELGGHSLLAIQLVARLRESLEVELPVQQLFEAASVAGLAEFLAKELEPAPEQEERAAELLEMVAGLTEDQVKEMLAEEEGPSEA